MKKTTLITGQDGAYLPRIPTKAREKLDWTPNTTLPEMVAEMVQADYTSAKRDALVKLARFRTFDHHE